LSPPPPERFHPSGQTNYQAIEEPIVKGMLGTSAVSRIEMVHPTVKGAENIYYQIWPVDNTTTWTARFGELNVQKRRWRMVKTLKALSNKLGDMEIVKAHQEAKEKKEEKKAKEKAKEKKAKEEKARKARKEKKKARKAKKEKKKAKKKAKKLEKEEKANNQGRSEPIS
jgi:flagellar biosynthesis GTPase FlhF